MEPRRKFAQEIWEKLCDELGLVGTDLLLIDRLLDGLIGAYFGGKNKSQVVINLARARTKRDVIFLLAHEARHAWQRQKLGDDKFFRLSDYGNATTHNVERYNLTLLEVDANRFAFDYENKMNYNNEVYHKRVYSHFIDLKKMHNEFDPAIFDIASNAAQRIFS